MVGRKDGKIIAIALKLNVMLKLHLWVNDGFKLEI
jgi:hypothetical protein